MSWTLKLTVTLYWSTNKRENIFINVFPESFRLTVLYMCIRLPIDSLPMAASVDRLQADLVTSRREIESLITYHILGQTRIKEFEVVSQVTNMGNCQKKIPEYIFLLIRHSLGNYYCMYQNGRQLQLPTAFHMILSFSISWTLYFHAVMIQH